MKPRVLLISTVHPAQDPRIAYKIAPSLAERYEVVCLIPSSGFSGPFGAKAFSLPFFKHLFWRLLLCHPVVLWKGLVLRPVIVQIFVPELIPVAMIFKWLGVHVIYEVQENMFKKFEIKRYNNARVFRLLFTFFDAWARRNFRIVVTEVAYLNEYRHLRYEPNVIRNFVSLPFIDRYSFKGGQTDTIPVFLYLGVVSMERCFDTLVAALVILKQTHPVFRVDLYGPIRFDLSEAYRLPEFDLVSDHLVFHGYTDQREMLPVLANVVAGLALLKPVADYPDSYPTKIFEYMALSLPVITSDFPLYRQVVEDGVCGFCIDPFSSGQLARTMAEILDMPHRAQQMGTAGRKIVETNYNWENEKKVLLDLYSKTAETEMDERHMKVSAL